MKKIGYILNCGGSGYYALHDIIIVLALNSHNFAKNRYFDASKKKSKTAKRAIKDRKKP